MSPEVETRIQNALTQVRPYLQADGGDVTFVRMRDDGILELSWTGTCKICPMSVMTLRAGVERTIMKEVPEVRRVETV
ncbi:MAG: nitrogen-fixing NifU domain protein [Bacteroidetes bacterium]|jgi:Fe-S cluster biogenesis protein NfuA|nr:nitrogen-fixing NifU domain protein [Bacteroidota bacterium]